MKKLFIAIFCLTALTVTTDAKETSHYIMTDCGTVHKVPEGCSDMAVGWLDFWTSVDC